MAGREITGVEDLLDQEEMEEQLLYDEGHENDDMPASSHEADRSRMDLTQDMTSPAAAPRADNGAEERPSAPQQEQNRAASAAAPPAKGHRLETWRTRGRGRGSRGPHPYAEPRRSWAPPRTQDPEAPMGAPPPHLPPRGYGPPRDYDNGPLVEGAAWAERDREREGRGNGHPPFEGRERDWEGAAPVPYAETRGVCPRCGRDNHPLRDCQAIKDIHGRYLSDPPPSRHRDSIKCHRCGRSGHLTRNCVQARDVDGRDIPSPPGVVPFEPGTADASSFRCVRCGRAGHPFRECAYARDIHGHIIHAPPGAVPPPRHPDGRPPTHPRGPESPARGARWEPPPAERRLPYIEDVALHPAGPHGSRSRSRSPRPRPLPSSSPSPPPPPSMPSPSRSASVPRGAEEGAAREERREEGGPRGGGGRGSESGSESDEGHGDPGARADRRGDASDAPGSSRNGSAADGTRGEAAEGDGPPARLAQGLGAASVPPAWGSGGLIKKAKEHAQRQEAPGRADPQPGGAPGPSREAEEPPREHRPAPAPAAPAPPSAVDRGGLAAAPAGPSPSTTAAGWATFGIPAPPLGAPAAPAAVPGNPLAAAAPSGVPYGPAGGAPGVPPPEGPTLDESEQEVQLMLPSAGVVIHYPVYFHFGRGLLQNRHGTLLPTFAGDVRMLVSEGRLLEESLADMSQRGEVAWGEADMQDDDVVRDFEDIEQPPLFSRPWMLGYVPDEADADTEVSMADPISVALGAAVPGGPLQRAGVALMGKMDMEVAMGYVVPETEVVVTRRRNRGPKQAPAPNANPKVAVATEQGGQRVAGMAAEAKASTPRGCRGTKGRGVEEGEVEVEDDARGKGGQGGKAPKRQVEILGGQEEGAAEEERGGKGRKRRWEGAEVEGDGQASAPPKADGKKKRAVSLGFAYEGVPGVCERCGKSNHTLDKCFSRKTVDGDVLNDGFLPQIEHDSDVGTEIALSKQCRRCGQHGHIAKHCDAEYHVDGTPLELGEVVQQSCHRCGREGHVAARCTELLTVDGRAIGSGRADKRKGGKAQKGGKQGRAACQRCGRPGHTAETCYAATNIHNKRINTPAGAVPRY